MALSMTRERFLEQKISMLDKRLTLVERFVELRFKDAFQTFSTPEPDDNTNEGGNQDGVEFEDIFILNPDDSGSYDEVKQLPKNGGPGTTQKKRAGKGLSGQIAKRMKSNLSGVPSEEGITQTEVELPGLGDDDNIKEPEFQTRSNVSGRNKMKIEPTSEHREPHAMNENLSDDNQNADDGSVDAESESSYPIVEQKVNIVRGVISEDGSYIEFFGPRTDELDEAEVTSRRNLRSLTKSKRKNSGPESGTSGSGGNRKATETQTTRRGNNSHKRRSQNRNSCGTKSGRKGTARKRNEESQYMEERGTLKKRIYAPALCSTLPSVARGDPTRRECPMCRIHIKNEFFEAHMASHVKERHLKCSWCDKRYFNQSMLRKHRMIHQPEKYGKKCRICEKLFFQGDKKLAHERFCVKRALEKKDFVNPEIIQDLKNRCPGWTAEEEPVSYTDPLELKECSICNKMFKANFYQRHLKTHTQTKHWACNLCDKEYFHKHDLVRHFISEHRSPTCDLCSRTFKDKMELMDHVAECRKNYKSKSTKSSRLTTKGEHMLVTQSVEIDQPEVPKNISEPEIEGSEKLESTANFNDNGGTVTLLSEDIIVVSSNVEVSQLEQSNSLV